MAPIQKVSNRCEDCERRVSGPHFHGRYSRRELRGACERLGLERPVRVIVRPEWVHAVRPGQYHDGLYEWDADRREHRVSVAGGINVDQANEAFVHELGHALQLERDGEEHAAASSHLGYLVFGYEDSPVEVEAREVGDRLKDEFRIARTGAMGGDEQWRR